MTIECSTCGTSLPIGSFHKNSSKRDGVDRECRSCTADRKLLSRHGLTRHEFNALLESQHGRCAICQDLPVGESLNVDHCHSSGRVRALLCRGCNTAIGLMGDDPGRIRAAAFYIESFSSQAFAA